MLSLSGKKLPHAASLDFKIWPPLNGPDFIPLRYSWCLQIQEMPNICFIPVLKPVQHPTYTAAVDSKVWCPAELADGAPRLQELHSQSSTVTTSGGPCNLTRKRLSQQRVLLFRGNSCATATLPAPPRPRSTSQKSHSK